MDTVFPPQTQTDRPIPVDTHKPVLNTPEPNGTVDERLVSLLKPVSFEADRYRTLRHHVELMHRTANVSVIAVSSPVVGDGKTTTAINLAGALAQAPRARVLLVDGDLRRPSVAASMGLMKAKSRGLVGLLEDARLELGDAVVRCARFNLSVLPAGRSREAPYELLTTPRLGDLLAAARQEYDYIVIDTSPLALVPDCRLLEQWVDGFFVVVSAHKTPRKMLEEAFEVVSPSKILGLVFNGDDRLLAKYSQYYGYYYASISAPKKSR